MLYSLSVGLLLSLRSPTSVAVVVILSIPLLSLCSGIEVKAQRSARVCQPGIAIDFTNSEVNSRQRNSLLFRLPAGSLHL